MSCNAVIHPMPQVANDFGEVERLRAALRKIRGDGASDEEYWAMTRVGLAQIAQAALAQTEGQGTSGESSVVRSPEERDGPISDSPESPESFRTAERRVVPDNGPARLVPPWRVAFREVEARFCKVEALMQAIGNRYMQDDPLTPEDAEWLQQEFGTSAELWLNLEKKYREGLDKGHGVV